MKGEWGGKGETKVRVETQQGREARVRGLPEGRLRGKRHGVGQAAAQGSGGPRSAEQRPGGARRKGLRPGQGAGAPGSASPAEGRALEWPQGAGRPGGARGDDCRRGRTPELRGADRLPRGGG